MLLGWDAQGKTLDNAEIARICAQSGGRFIGFGSVDPNREDALERLEEVAGAGPAGPEAPPDAAGLRSRRRPLPAVLRRRGRTRADRCSPTPGTSGLGAGEPGGQGLRIDLARPILLDRIAARHPHMQIVLAHVGWPWHLEAVAMALHKSNVYLDISGWKYRYLPDEVKREIPRRLRGQFCFGTDFPMFDPEACLAELDRLELPPRRRPRGPARQRRRAARPVTDDPEHEAREKMRELAAAGDLAGAIGEYARLEHRLRADFGVEPSRETKRLLDELRASAPPPLGKPRRP